MFLRNLRIGTRLALGFGAVLAVMLTVSIAGTWLGKKSRDDLAGVVATAGAKQNLAAEMKARALEQAAVMRNIGLHSDLKAMHIDRDPARSLGPVEDDARARWPPVGLTACERE